MFGNCAVITLLTSPFGFQPFQAVSSPASLGRSSHFLRGDFSLPAGLSQACPRLWRKAGPVGPTCPVDLKLSRCTNFVMNFSAAFRPGLSSEEMLNSSTSGEFAPGQRAGSSWSGWAAGLREGSGSESDIFLFFKLWVYFIYLFIYLWLCWVFVSVRGLSLVAASGGHSSSRCAGLSLSRPLLLQSTGSRRAGSVVVAHGLSCSAACGILPDQGSNLCPLHWQADSQPLRHQGSLKVTFFTGLHLFLVSAMSPELIHLGVWATSALRVSIPRGGPCVPAASSGEASGWSSGALCHGLLWAHDWGVNASVGWLVEDMTLTVKDSFCTLYLDSSVGPKSVFVRILWRNRTDIYTWGEREGEKDWFVRRNWLTCLWRPASPQMCRVTPLETQESWWCSLTPKAGKSQCPSSKAVRQEEFPLSHGKFSLFVLFMPSTNWTRPTHTG